jgi:hypothetical protein
MIEIQEMYAAGRSAAEISKELHTGVITTVSSSVSAVNPQDNFKIVHDFLVFSRLSLRSMSREYLLVIQTRSGTPLSSFRGIMYGRMSISMSPRQPNCVSI